VALTQLKQYLRPTSLEEALTSLREGGKGARVIGGGIELVLFSPPDVTTLIDLSELSLSYIKENEAGLAIGATTTLTQIIGHQTVAQYLDGVIVGMLHQVASPLLRNLATIGGSLASANPWSDVIPLFLALDAKVTLFDGKYRSIPLSDLYPTRSHLSGSILTEVLLPVPAPRTAASFHQFSRTGFDVALLNCACLVKVDAGRCTVVRIVAGGTPRLGAALPAAEEALMGMELTDETIERVAHVARESVDTRDDRRASARYRKQLTYVFVKRCLQGIRDRLAEGKK